MILKTLQLGPMANFVYLIADGETKECAVVDPAWDVPAILRAVEQEGLKLARVLVTHNHPDHINGVAELLASADVPVHVHGEDAFALKAVQENLRPARSGDKVRLGKLELTFLHTPGHTAGSQCFLVEDRVVTGDTLFIGACGRVDLPGSDPEKMYQSLKRLSQLPAKTLILPGHDYGEVPTATVEEERRRNRYLQAAAGGLDDFLALTGA